MEFEELFDEIESNFAAHKSHWDANTNLLNLQTIDQQSVSLLAPIIGKDFIAGLDQQNADWLCFANSSIAKFKPLKSSDDELPLIRSQEISFVDFIKTIDRPVRVTAKFSNQFEWAFNLLDADERFLIAEENQLIPLQSIVQLRMLGTNTWQ